MYDGVAWLVNSVITAFQNKLRKAGFSGDRLEKFKMTGGAVDAVDTEIAAFQAKKAARGEEVAAASIDVDQAREILNQKGAGGGRRTCRVGSGSRFQGTGTRGYACRGLGPVGGTVSPCRNATPTWSNP